MKVKKSVKSDILKTKDISSTKTKLNNVNLKKSQVNNIKSESVKSNDSKANFTKKSETNFRELQANRLIKKKVKLIKTENSTKVINTRLKTTPSKRLKNNKLKSNKRSRKILKTNRSKSKVKRLKINKVLNFKKEYYFNQVFLKFLLKKGDINKAKKIFKNTFNILFRDTGLGSYSILSQIYLKLHINFEIRRIKVRRNSHIVPVPLNAKRRYYLICKWIFDSVNANKSYQEFSVKLAAELLKILKDQNCESIAKKKMVQSTAISNRSNTHYRW